MKIKDDFRTSCQKLSDRLQELDYGVADGYALTLSSEVNVFNTLYGPVTCIYLWLAGGGYVCSSVGKRYIVFGELVTVLVTSQALLLYLRRKISPADN